MTELARETTLLTILLLSRIGGCLLLMPGFSSSRVPAQIRIFMALGVTLAMVPMMHQSLKDRLPDLAPASVVATIISETAIGLLIGLSARIFFVALGFMGTAIAMYVGFQGTPDAYVEEGEPAPALSVLITLTATLLFFLADLHIEVLKALVDTYSVLPVGISVNPELSVRRLAATFADAFLEGLQLSAPFLIWSLIINFLFGLLNKLTPQVPVFFISTPFVVAGGMLLLYFSVGEGLRLFIEGFSIWLSRI